MKASFRVTDSCCGCHRGSTAAAVSADFDLDSADFDMILIILLWFESCCLAAHGTRTLNFFVYHPVNFPCHFTPDPKHFEGMGSYNAVEFEC